MSRSRASAKAAGRGWEKDICEYLVSLGWPYVERRRQAGINDRGDIAGIPGLVIEAKNTKGYDIAGAVNEAIKERENAGAKYGVAWIKRHGKGSARDGYVVMDGDTFTQLLKEAGY